MTIDELIEELRAELKACLGARETHRIERELQAALAERMRLETALEPFG
jgi:hypothetical protein